MYYQQNAVLAIHGGWLDTPFIPLDQSLNICICNMALAKKLYAEIKIILLGEMHIALWGEPSLLIRVSMQKV